MYSIFTLIYLDVTDSLQSSSHYSRGGPSSRPTHQDEPGSRGGTGSQGTTPNNESSHGRATRPPTHPAGSATGPQTSIDTTYTNNAQSMLGYVYHAAFWTATKIE